MTWPARSRPFTPWTGRASLARQLVLLALLPAIVTTVVVVGVLTRQHLGAIAELMRANAQTVALQVAALAQAPLARMDRRVLARTAQSALRQPDVLQVQIWSDDGEIVARAQAPGAPPGQPSLRAVESVLGEDRAPIGQVMVEIGLASVERARADTLRSVGLLLLASLAGIGGAGCWAARRIGGPIRRLGDAMDRLGAGEEVRVPVEGTAEIGRLQAGFNEAARALAENRRTLQVRIEEATAELARKNAQLEAASLAKTRLLAAASHDLRQPLHALTLFSDALGHGERDPARLQHIGHMRECVAALDRLFSELLNLSQLEAGVQRPTLAEFSLDALFTEVSRNFRTVAEAQELRLVVRQTDEWVRSDYLMLSRILNNLISNALRHTRRGGVLLAARRRGQRVRIEVWDTGIGIAREHQARVFEEFYQVEPQQRSQGVRGLGLGLATVRRLADLLDIPVTLKSVPGHGTLVSALVDRATPLPVPPAAPLASGLTADPEFAGLSVLVVDDEPSILEGLQWLLRLWGAEVMSSPGLEGALALADRWQRAPDLVVTDLLLGNGASGLDVLRALDAHPRGTGARTARLLVTGETKPERLQETARAGVAVLYKPVAPALLREAIRMQLRRVAARDVPRPVPKTQAPAA